MYRVVFGNSFNQLLLCCTMNKTMRLEYLCQLIHSKHQVAYISTLITWHVWLGYYYVACVARVLLLCGMCGWGIITWHVWLGYYYVACVARVLFLYVCSEAGGIPRDQLGISVHSSALPHTDLSSFVSPPFYLHR